MEIGKTGAFNGFGPIVLVRFKLVLARVLTLIDLDC